MTPRKTPALIAALALAALAPAARAQDAAPVLKDSQVTESALINALSIDTGATAEGKTRGFRPATGPAAAGAHAPAPQKAGPGKASLLITFTTDSATLTPSAEHALDVVAKALQSDQLAGLSFDVEGHADPRGGEAHNLVLSKERAEAVVDYLVTHHGVLRERLNAVGKGSSEPLDTVHPDAPENRRVTVVTRRG